MSVLTLRPNSDDTPLEQAVTPTSPTTHYDKIDEETLNESDYCSSDASLVVGYSEKTDIYGFPDHTSESGTINSVKVLLKAKYITVDDTYTVYIAPCVKIGSTQYNSAYQTLTSSTAEYSYTWTTNPATSSAWTWTEIDSLLAGNKQKVHCTEQFKKYRNIVCYQLWVEVNYTPAAVGHPTIKRWGGVPFMRLNKGIWCL